MLRKLVSISLVVVMLLSLSIVSVSEENKTGTYTKTVNAMFGPLTIEMVFKDGKIETAQVTQHNETPGVGEQAAIMIPHYIVEQQSVSVDVLTGATYTSRAVLRAAEECLKESGVILTAVQAEPSQSASEKKEFTADVVIVGGGGAGLSAAVTAVQAGASVILIEKAGFLGGNSIVAGGIYNAPDPDKQKKADVKGDLHSLVEAALAEKPVSDEHKQLQDAIREEYKAFQATGGKLFDSANWFALQTWNGGDKLADLPIVKLLAGNAYDSMKWLESQGMEFSPDITPGAGSLYMRTHAAVLPNGTGYIDAFNRSLQGKENYTLMLETTGQSLIIKDGEITGVIATDREGNELTLHAGKGVILATGGFAGNVQLRQEYCEGEKWPDLGSSVPTSNMATVTGDGIFMARDAGAQLVNMDQIQLLPYCNPYTGATYDICRPSLAGIFVNVNGERFVREDGRRDVMSRAIIEQPEGYMYMVFSADSAPDPTTAGMLGGHNLAYYLENNLAGYVKGDTVEELAEKIKVPAETLKATFNAYNSYVDGTPDPLGRITYQFKLETGPFYAYPRKPAVHHTMGGVWVDEHMRALTADGTPVSGLYCAGEITGNVHGSNRLGGNAIVDFTVFGRIAGESVLADHR